MSDKSTTHYLRVLTIEICRLAEDKDEHWRQFRELQAVMVQVQELSNFVYDEWRAWHHANGSRAKLLEFQAAWKAWRESKSKEKKPQCPVPPITPELGRQLYGQAVKLWPDLHTRAVTLTIKRLTGNITAGKAAKGNWPKWHAQLLHREQIPSFTGPCPINFDPKVCYLEPPKPGTTDSFKLHVTIQREPVEGRKNKQGVTYHGTVWDKGKRMRSRKQTLQKIASEEYTLAGSQLFIKDGKLFAALSYWQPKPAMIDSSEVCVVRASATHPLSVRIKGRTQWVGGDGRLVREIRRQVTGQRWSRQDTYRRASSSSRKGHGLRRAMHKVTIQTPKWRDFAKTFNRNLASELCRRAVEAGCGIVLFAQTDKESRYLSCAGRSGERDASRWDWFGLEKAVAHQCEEVGLTFDFRARKTRSEQSGESVMAR